MVPPKNQKDISLKAAMLYLNRFCIEEDAACELSGVHYLKESSNYLASFVKYADSSEQLQADKNAKGKVYFLDIEKFIVNILFI